MPEDGEIVVTEEARQLMTSLESNDPGAPSAFEAVTVTGANSTEGAQAYRNQMRIFMNDSRTSFQSLLSLIRQDCVNAGAAIDDLDRQDQEIMRLLQQFDAETVPTGSTAAPAPNAPSGGGPTVSAPGGGSSDTDWE
ncbi:MAG: hypothetical protein ACTIJ6_00595 [Leucobacter sp.]